MLKNLIVVSFLFGLFSACGVEPTVPEKAYLFLGHPYDWSVENRIDQRILGLDLNRFDGIWLGGDVCARTSKDTATLNHLLTQFPFQDRRVHWTWGNHDLMDGDSARLSKVIDRPSYYTEDLDGLQLIVLNTNLFWQYPWNPPTDRCAAKEAQVNWLNHVLDTLSEQRPVLIMHHLGLLVEYKRNAKGDTLRLGNVDATPIRTTCDPERTFSKEFYPKLAQLRQAGHQVILVSGDVGMRSKGFAHTTKEGIHILGSGINNSLDFRYAPDYVTNFNPDSVLVFHHVPFADSVSWAFHNLNQMLVEQ